MLRILNTIAALLMQVSRPLPPVHADDTERLSHQAHAELLKLHELAADDIKKFQDRQTTITNYAVVADAALLAYARLFPARSWITVFALSALTTAAAVAAWCWLDRLQSAMFRARGRVDRVRERMTPEYHRACGDLEPTERVERWDTIHLLGAVLLIAGLLTVVGIWMLAAPVRRLRG